MFILVSVAVATLAGLLFLCFPVLAANTGQQQNRELIGWIILAANAIPLGLFGLYTTHNPYWIEGGRWYVLFLILFQFASLIFLGILIVRAVQEKLH